MSRRFQFSLRALLAAATIAAAILRWHNNRIEVLADSFVDLIHQRRYKDSEAVAAWARRLYPNELLARHMESMCRIFFHKEEPPTAEEPGLSIDVASWKKLVDEHRAAMPPIAETCCPTP
jgi:hypothetical protein